MESASAVEVSAALKIAATAAPEVSAAVKVAAMAALKPSTAVKVFAAASAAESSAILTAEISSLKVSAATEAAFPSSIKVASPVKLAAVEAPSAVVVAAAEPRAGSDEDAAGEPLGTIVAVGRARVRVIIIVAVVAQRRTVHRTDVRRGHSDAHRKSLRMREAC
jgi:hypothetical protein